MTHILTADLRRQIAATIRAGCYPHVAAGAFGVPQAVFERWLELGESENDALFAEFAAEVREAEAQARLRAETATFAKDAKLWLQHGPGRERPGRPGWSTAVKANETSTTPLNPLLSEEITAAFQALLTTLLPYPEARTAVAQYLWSLGLETSTEKHHDRESRTIESEAGAEAARGAGGHGEVPVVPAAAGGPDGEDGAGVSVPVPEGE